MKSTSKKVISILLAIIMTIPMSLPFSAFAEGENNQSYGGVEAITKGLTINSENEQKIAITNEDKENIVTLDWCEKDEEIDRYQDGWWIGLKVTAPENYDKDKAQIKIESAEKEMTVLFSEARDSVDEDSEQYACCWLPVSEEDYEAYNAESEALDYTRTISLDWDGNGEFELVANVSINLLNIELKKDDEHYHITALENGEKATCTKEGKEADKVCILCKKIIEEGKSITKLGHTYDAGVVTTEPTCTSEGVKTYTCTVCAEGTTGHSYTETIPATGHSYKLVCYDKDNNPCDEKCNQNDDAVTICYECVNEGCESRLKEIKAVICHTPVSAENAVPATCTTKGKEADTICDVCKKTLVTGAEIDALKHTYDEGVQTKAPTCTEKGIMTYTCTREGCTDAQDKHSYTEPIPANGHTAADEKVNVKPATCKENGYTGDVICKDCSKVLDEGDVINAGNEHHNWVNGKCDICGAAASIATKYNNNSKSITTSTPIMVGDQGVVIKVTTKMALKATLTDTAKKYFKDPTLKACADGYTITITPKSPNTYTDLTKLTDCTVTLSEVNGKCNIANTYKIIMGVSAIDIPLSNPYIFSTQKASINYTVTYIDGKTSKKTFSFTPTTSRSDRLGSVNVKWYNASKTYKYYVLLNTSVSSLSAVSKGFTVKWAKKTTYVTGYQIQYSTSSSFSSAKTVTVKGAKNVSKKITKLSSKKKYYVRVRTYFYNSADKKTYYSAWSASKSVTTKK